MTLRKANANFQEKKEIVIIIRYYGAIKVLNSMMEESKLDSIMTSKRVLPFKNFIVNFKFDFEQKTENFDNILINDCRVFVSRHENGIPP